MPKETTEENGRSQYSQREEALEDMLAAEAAESRRLPVFIFVATFLGTLLGIFADLSDASGLLAPVLEFVDPSPQLHIVGSNTVLGEGIGVIQERNSKSRRKRRRAFPCWARWTVTPNSRWRGSVQ
jgi:hypothetical protein